MTANRLRADGVRGRTAAFALLGFIVLGGPDGGARGVHPGGKPAAPPTLRVVSFNIRHGVGMDGKLDLDRSAAVLRRLEPDLVALQEVDERCRRSGGVDQAAALGKALGMEHRFGEFMDYDGGRYGLAVLSRLPIKASRSHDLPRGAEPRSALEVEVEPEWLDRPLSFTCVHHDWTAEAIRVRQMKALVAALGERRPAIIAGDFNGEPGSESLAVVDDPAASDHRPILAVFSFAADASAAPRDILGKINFDLDLLDADGLAGPADGKVAISYEFRIPDTPENRAAVQAIDPGIEITSGSPGLVNAGPGFALCIGSTHQRRHREIVIAVAGLPFVEQIIPCVFE